MPLPSQTARTAPTGRATMYRQSRGSIRPLLIAIGGVAAVVMTVFAVRWVAGGTHVAAADQPRAAKGAAGGVPGAGPQEPAPKLLAMESPPEPAAPVVELRQGRQPASESAMGLLAGSPAAAALQPQTKPQLGHTAGVPTGGEAAKPSQPAATPPPSASSEPGAAISAPPDLQPTVAAARQKQSAGELVAARALYSRALADARMPEPERAQIRAELTKINEDLVFSPRVAQDDPFCQIYAVQAGDSITKIAQKLALGPDRRLIKRINRMADEHRLNIGQKLKVIKPPFHAVVTKSAFRLDLYLGPTDKPDQWVYVRSFRVGLGEAGSTPVGNFVVKKGSKLVDPPWINPHTGQRFDGHDPKNPIGKFWVGLEGVGEASQHTGYGIHGTIDPDSIGQQRSMGCVRMAADDIALVFELMGEQVSTVKIQP